MLRFVFTKTARYPGHEVEHNQFMRNLRTLAVSIKYRGLRRTVLGLLANIFAKARLSLLEEYRFFKQNIRESGLDTTGIVECDKLDIPDERRGSARRYEASSDYEFRYVLEKLHIDYSNYHFVDYGSGKGAILAAAARYPFRSVTGVELSQALHETARDNIAKLQDRGRVRSGALTSVHGDAASYRLPAAAHVIYVFNAFGPDVLKDVLARISEYLADVREPVYFLYNNPMHHSLLDESPEYDRLRNAFGGKWKVYVRRGGR